MQLTRRIKAAGTFEIRMAFSAADKPCYRMFADYRCSNCGERRSLMRGGTPSRTVTIEQSEEGCLLSVEVMHPDLAMMGEILDATPLPTRATCGARLQSDMLLDMVRSYT